MFVNNSFQKKYQTFARDKMSDFKFCNTFLLLLNDF